MSFSEGTVARTLPQRPVHLDPSWRYMPLNDERKPVVSEEADPRFWAGAEADWEAFLEWTEDGNAIGILPERSDLVILDCDCRREFVIDGSRASTVLHHGIEDLKKVAAEHGEIIPATFAVSTKSGGFHLYYRQNPLLTVTSKGHREGWRIDVKASRNVYAVAPPTTGYTVVRDAPVAVLPLWLASWIRTVNQSTRPVGDSVVTERLEAARNWKIDIQELGSGSSLFDLWCRAMLGAVEASNRHGGWNNAIYRVAREFFDVGLPQEAALAMIVQAARPYDETQRRMVERTVESAWRGHRDKTG